MNTQYYHQQPPTQGYIIMSSAAVNQQQPRQVPIQNQYTIQQNDRRSWRDGLCSWSANIVPSCFMALFCQCIILGQLSQASGFAPFPLICCGYILIYIFFIILGAYFFGVQVLIWLCVALIIWSLRKKVRTNENLSGDDCEDCAVSFFCQSCTISQMARHLYQYRQECDEFVCSGDGRPSYYNQNNNQGNTPTWQQAPPPNMYVSQSSNNLPPQYISYPPPQTTTAQYVQPPQQPTIVKAGWEGNIGGASAYPYSQSNQPGVVGVVTPTIVSVQALPSSTPQVLAAPAPAPAPAPPRSQQYYEEEGP